MVDEDDGSAKWICGNAAKRRLGQILIEFDEVSKMEIMYTDLKKYTVADLTQLFQSVNWLSANYPERLKKALDYCETVYTAWHGGELVGLVNAIDDGELTAYVHYLCVNPLYQDQGIGGKLLDKIKEKYARYLYIILIAEDQPLVKYYSRNGFEYMDGRYVLTIQNE